MSDKIIMYHSCFIADVQITDSLVRLQDTSKAFYYIDIHNEEVMKSFKTWLQEVFLRCKAQTLTIFKYEVRAMPDCVNEPAMFVTKIMNATSEKKICNLAE